MTLEPLSQIETVGDLLESTGDDPALLMRSHRGRLPTGWCLLSLQVVTATTTLAPTLYLDRGQGFSDASSLGLPPIRVGWIHQLIQLPRDVTALRLDPTIEPARFRFGDVTIREIGRVRMALLQLIRYGRHWRRIVSYIRKCGWVQTWRMLSERLVANRPLQGYDAWIELYDTLGPEDEAAILADLARLPVTPTISVIMPVTDPRTPDPEPGIRSVLAQLYPHWRLIVADASADAATGRRLDACLGGDPRAVILRPPPGDDCASVLNAALAACDGDFVTTLPPGDLLPRHALHLVAGTIARDPDVDIVYSDEDSVTATGTRFAPFFKPDWNPDLMTGINLIGRSGVFRRALVAEIGGWRSRSAESGGYDLALRAAERTMPSRIRHIPHILRHVHGGRHDHATPASARDVVQDHLDRQGTGAVASLAGNGGCIRVRHPLPTPPPAVTLIVPTRDRVDLLRQCLDGLLRKTDYPDLDVIVVDNGSRETETHAYLAALAADRRVTVMPMGGPFNFSALNNAAVAQARGEVVGLINNDVVVIEPGWLTEMVSHLVRPGVGVVGAKLLFADDRVQHAGIVLGIHGVADHAHKFSARHHAGYFGRLMLTQNVSGVTAACLLTHKALYRDLGGLDEANLPVGFNDVDFCLRVTERGHRIVWTPHAELYHLESVSRGSDNDPAKIERFIGELTFMKNRWGKRLLCDPCYSPNLTLDNVNFDLAFPPRTRKPWLG